MLTNSTVLDNLRGIRQVDKSNMLSFCVDAPKHYEKAVNLAETFSVDYPKPQNIIVSGMGGSAIGGELLKDWARNRITVPIEVYREYSLPAYADKNTLVIVISYSGETEESLSAFLDAVKRKCKIVTICSGGALGEFSKKLGLPHLQVPSGMAPRASLPYLFTSLPILLEKIGLQQNVSSEISEAIKVLKQISEMNKPEKPLNDNFAKTLATNADGTVPVVYGFGFYRAVAQRWKTQFNENSKVPAKWESFPELDHNEIVGWEEAKTFAKHFSVILIRDKHEAKAIHERITGTKELLKKELLKTFDVHSAGISRFAKMASAICIGDFVSVYLAVLRGVDPTPVRTISLLKERIKEGGIKEKVISELQKKVKKHSA
jgi:glucose/mannose-6-phosphate isomerase